jgi:hypothetical protein
MDFQVDPEIYRALVSGSILGLIGLLFWFVKVIFKKVMALFKEFRLLQKETHRDAMNHEKVQTQLASLQMSQVELQKDINLILETLLHKELKASALTRKRREP